MRASDMLSGATVAGIASSFGKTREKLEEELISARTAFYLSILVLALLASPMFFYVFPIWGLSPPRDSDAVVVLRDLLARLALLLPGIWLVGFTAKRHSSLFRLREHYQYKYSMAFSVEGFKMQAEDLGPEIAGTTFYEILTHNPADAMDGRRESALERRSEPLLKRLIQRLSKDG